MQWQGRPQKRELSTQQCGHAYSSYKNAGRVLFQIRSSPAFAGATASFELAQKASQGFLEILELAGRVAASLFSLSQTKKVSLTLLLVVLSVLLTQVSG